METVVMIIMAMVCLGFVLKLSWLGWGGRIAVSLVAAVFLLLTYDMAASQSKLLVGEWLGDPALMLDTAVWLTVDVAFQIAFCMLMAGSLYGRLTGVERIMLGISRWLPGILIFPTLFAILTELIFTFTGVDFATTAWSMVAGVIVGIPLLAAAVEYIIPESDIRLEVTVMVNIIIAALGIVATVNGRTAAAGSQKIEWTAMAGVALIILGGLAAGAILYRYLTSKKISRLQ